MLEVEPDAGECGVMVGYNVGEDAAGVSVGDVAGNVGVGPAAGARVSDPLVVDVGSAMGVSATWRVGSVAGAIAPSLVAIGMGIGVGLR